MGSRGVWGIDVGQNSLKAVRLEWIDRVPTITAFESIPYQRTLPESAPERLGLVRAALHALAAKHGIRGDRTYVAIPGNVAFTKTVKLPPVDRRQIPQIVGYEARQQIPQIDEVRWDYHIFEAEAGGEVEVGLYAVKRAFLDDLLAPFAGLPFEVEAVQVAPLALYNFARYEYPDEPAFVLVDFGSANTDFVSVHGKRFWVRNIRIAGNTITKSLQEKLNLSFEEAENLKCKAGQSAQVDRIFAIMVPILRELLGEIQRSLGFFKSQHKDVRFEEILVMGNALRLEGFEHFLEKNLQYKVRKPGSLRRIARTEDVDPVALQDQLLSMGVAVGLALQGLGAGASTVNLAPEEAIGRARLRRMRPAAAAAAAILWLFVGADHLVHHARGRVLEEIGREIQALQTNYLTLKANHDAYAEQVGVLNRKKDELLDLAKGVDREHPEVFLKVLDTLSHLPLFQAEPPFRIRRVVVDYGSDAGAGPAGVEERDPDAALSALDGDGGVPEAHVRVRFLLDVRDPKWEATKEPKERLIIRGEYLRRLEGQLVRTLRANRRTLASAKAEQQARCQEIRGADPPEFGVVWRLSPEPPAGREDEP